MALRRNLQVPLWCCVQILKSLLCCAPVARSASMKVCTCTCTNSSSVSMVWCTSSSSKQGFIVLNGASSVGCDSEWKSVKAHLGVVTYENTCETLHVSPQNAVIRGLQQPTFSLRHRNLGPFNIRPVAIALVVRYHVTNVQRSENRLATEVSVTHIQ